MNFRLLSSVEKSILDALRNATEDYALIYLTSTGLKKSILDSTESVRALLKQHEIHDYGQQGQGPENKRLIQVQHLSIQGALAVQASVYRPRTKNGDPRIWFSGLASSAVAGDVLVLLIRSGVPLLCNLTGTARQGFAIEGDSWLAEWIRKSSYEIGRSATELLSRLQEIAGRGYIPTGGIHDTSIGREIERLLGIEMNSSKDPDFQGIEIKTKRWNSPATTRYTLFAQVPDWTLSRCKSSDDILELLGYSRLGVQRLYCSVSTSSENSQGLRLEILTAVEQLLETSRDHGAIAIWPLPKLHERLLTKHPESFWINVETKGERTDQLFRVTAATHTRRPSVAQFDSFLSSGIITLDHLIKRTGMRAREKGPFFKIPPKHLLDLFLSPPRKYELG